MVFYPDFFCVVFTKSRIESFVLLTLIGRKWSFQVIARIVDGSKFDEFKALYGDTLVTGTGKYINVYI